MEDNYRNNVIELALIYLDKTFNDLEDTEFKSNEFTSFIYKQLFNIDIIKFGFGKDFSTKEMTNDIGDLKIYNELDSQKINYLSDIKKGDLVFFHTKDKEANSPATNNHYPGHVGIYLEDGNFIHVSPIEEKIAIDKFDEYWLNILVASRDIIKDIINKKTMF